MHGPKPLQCRMIALSRKPSLGGALRMCLPTPGPPLIHQDRATSPLQPDAGALSDICHEMLDLDLG